MSVTATTLKKALANYAKMVIDATPGRIYLYAYSFELEAKTDRWRFVCNEFDKNEKTTRQHAVSSWFEADVPARAKEHALQRIEWATKCFKLLHKKVSELSEHADRYGDIAIDSYCMLLDGSQQMFVFAITPYGTQMVSIDGQVGYEQALLVPAKAARLNPNQEPCRLLEYTHKNYSETYWYMIQAGLGKDPVMVKLNDWVQGMKILRRQVFHCPHCMMERTSLEAHLYEYEHHSMVNCKFCNSPLFRFQRPGPKLITLQMLYDEIQSKCTNGILTENFSCEEPPMYWKAGTWIREIDDYLATLHPFYRHEIRVRN